jgi:hypothetical protein
VTEPAEVARMDQMGAAFRTWAECLRVAWTEVMKQGVPQERALDIADGWILAVIQTLGIPHD